jgi:leucyl aminopeptidase
MLLCLQDMGGAALMLALSHVIISAQLPVRLRVLLPRLSAQQNPACCFTCRTWEGLR